MKSTANRFGNAGPEGDVGNADVDARADTESSHGRHIVTPAPRSTVRREIRAIVLPFINTVTHRGRRGAPRTRRDDREYREYLRAGATQSAGMHRRPNATVFMKVST